MWSFKVGGDSVQLSEGGVLCEHGNELPVLPYKSR